MSSKSRQSRAQHEGRTGERQLETETPKTFAKVRSASGAKTERTMSGAKQSSRLAKSSMPLRRGQRGGTKG
ncbi:hypothetical protein OIE66_09535 [Nonomuraea sp. NBC_01738]|uniref:hypothetical protein n=1 Tax=Nonomuraea sp. NBC_01738 TaxID=2976003 RepID=UPI002E133F2E|nr:hypothetical protein OIE66_09535 [Nonomuraea sp. NBC_01738]